MAFERGNSKNEVRSRKNSKSRVTTVEVPLPTSQTLKEETKTTASAIKPTMANKSKEGEPKVHRGPLNVNAITSKDPKLVVNELMAVMTKLGVGVQREDYFSLSCKFKKVKFLVEVNSLERFSNIIALLSSSSC